MSTNTATDQTDIGIYSTGAQPVSYSEHVDC